MANTTIQSLKETMANRRYTRVAAFVVVVGALVLAMGLMYHPQFFVRQVEAPAQTATSTTKVNGAVMAKSLPTRIKIPEIKVDVPFSEPLGLSQNGEVEVPKDYVSVGYYKNGPTPGELGPAVVLGHVDSYKGPAVFFALGQLKEGDEITIERDDGTTVTFAVTEMERNEQSNFPTAKVYSNLNYAGLRLITCTGVYSHEKLRYSHNLIVYAKLVATSTINKTP
jgi:LPXTG-site transpeptidase (sortase) family protein